MTGEPRRSGRRNRRIAAGLLWLAVTYPLSFGTLLYADGRGWVPAASYPALRTLFLPFFSGGELNPAFDSYSTWWWDLGRRHAEGASH